MYKSRLKLFVGLLLSILLSCQEDEAPKEYYVFQPNAYYMVADGEKTLHFEVFKYDNSYLFENVTDQAAFFYNGTALDGNTFTTTATGVHKFVAKLGNWTSEEITVVARADKAYDLISIPLIFHILYNNEPAGTGANISKEDIEEVVNIINQRFRNTYYTLNHPNVIQSPNHVDTKIEFRLAQYDPQGNLLEEPGIKRYSGYDATKWENTEPQGIFLSQNMWSPHDYINVCVANQSITNGAILPVASNSHKICFLETTDETWGEYYLRNSNNGENIVFHGILMSLYSVIGAKALTHEIGHTLGLLHNFDTGCNLDRFPFGQDDCINDTQFYSESEYSTDFYRNKLFKECNTDNWVIHDNYMDYYRKLTTERFDDYYGFTYDQRDRMQEILEYSPWIKELKNSTK